MYINSGTLALYQNLGRLNLSLSANANKYWLPMQSTLLTQYGFSGHVSYDAASWITLHAFGNYYIEDLRLPPAISPYAYSTSFGGYADVRFSDHWGANLGAQRFQTGTAIRTSAQGNDLGKRTANADDDEADA